MSVADYVTHGGFEGLKKALGLTGAAIVAEVTESGLRGRGGAGFPTGIKWKTVHDAKADQKYICCNADEGDSGTFADRMVMEGDPLMLIEGMTIAGLAVGATKGYVYIRSEYPDAIATMKEAIAAAVAANWLGANIQGTDKSFHLEVRRGAGAYICGEETAMLESLEGKRGMVRSKPPIPALEGLFGKPTVINNVLSFAAVPFILAKGGAAYKNYGMGRSRGTLPFQLAGNIKQGGLVEKAFGVTLRELVEGFGGGTFTGKPIRAIQVGGPLGAYIPASQLDLPMDYETFAAAQRHGRPRRHRGVRRQRRHGRAGALRHGVLRHRILRQVHALPHRLDARRRGDRQDRRRAGPRRQPRTAVRPLPDHDGRLALRHGRPRPPCR